MPKIENNKIAVIRRQAGGLVETANNMVIRREDDAQGATELLVFLANSKKMLEEQRVFLVKPLNDHVKDINEKFKEWAKPMDEADSVVRSKMMEFQLEQEALRVTAEQERIERLAEVPEGDDLPEDLPDLPVVAPRTIRGDTGSTSVRKTWTFEITDEAKVPRKYMMADEGIIRLAVRDGKRSIPGIRIYQQESLAVRAK